MEVVEGCRIVYYFIHINTNEALQDAIRAPIIPYLTVSSMV